MGENQESPINIIENLALVTDAMQTLFPQGRMICVYELNSEDYKKVQSNFRKIDNNFNRFSVDMSGTEHVFINVDYIQPIEEPKKEYQTKKSLRNKILSWFKSSSSSIK